MKIELSYLISACSLIVALIVAIVNIRDKNYRADRESTSQITTLIVKLESIADGVNEIKGDMRNLKSDVQELRERLVLVERDLKEAQNRLNHSEQEKEKHD